MVPNQVKQPFWETFPTPSLEIPSTKRCDGRQFLGKSFSDEPSRIFFAGASEAQKEMSVSETPTKCISVHQSPLTPKLSERVMIETPAERSSETPTVTPPDHGS